MTNAISPAVEEAARFLRARRPDWPALAVVLGSAQAEFVSALANCESIPFAEIPGWPVPSVPGHAGQLITGVVRGQAGHEAPPVPVTVLSGRVHLFEGFSPQQVVFGVRVLGALGLKRLILTNAAGAINPAFHPGLLVLITDHINLQGVNPLVGPNVDEWGPRFPDMTQAYPRELRWLAKDLAAELCVEVSEGVYAGMLGPSFETPAEIRFLRTVGADLAGMSTVAETIAARHMGIQVLGISTVSNMAAGLQEELSHEEVLEIGRTSSEGLVRLLTALIPRL
ncbi:MAG: purine-nucleoside phosphorylase [Bryobacteraceae bacterium]